MIVSVRLSETDGVLFKKFAARYNLTISEFLRECAIEKINENYERDIFGIEVEKKKVMKEDPGRADK